jgi:hypothetical protein
VTRRLIDQAIQLIELGRADLAVDGVRVALKLTKPSKPRSGHVV